MVVRLEILGTGNAFLPQGRFHSLIMVDGRILIDCPPTALASLRRNETSPADLDAILITHWHGDHVFGFPFLLLERRWISDRTGDRHLKVIGPEDCENRLSDMCRLAYPGSMDDRLKEIEWNEQMTGEIDDEWSFERFEVAHDPVVDPHGYILEHSSGIRIMHTGDSGPCEAISSRAAGCKVVIMEMGVPEDVVIPHHFRPSTVAELAESCPDTLFLVTHTWLDDPASNNEPIISNTLPALPKNVIQLSDGDEFLIDSGSTN